MDRHTEAAAAYGEAIARTERGANGQLWTLHLLRAASLEQADRWVDAKAELEGDEAGAGNALLLASSATASLSGARTSTWPKP